MSETLETVLRASVRTLAAAAGLLPSRMHQLGKLTVLQTLPRNAVTSANAAGAPGLRTYLAHDESRRPACADGSALLPSPSSSIAAIPLGCGQRLGCRMLLSLKSGRSIVRSCP